MRSLAYDSNHCPRDARLYRSNLTPKLLLDHSLEPNQSNLTDPAENNTLSNMKLAADGPREMASPIPRIWTIPVVLIVSLIVYLGASMLAIVVAALIVHGKIDAKVFSDAKFINSLTQSRVGFPLIVFIPQAAMIVPVVFLATLSPLGFRQRLRLVRGHWPLFVWGVAAVATPLIGMISSLIVGLFLEDSESLVEMTRIFRDLANNGFLLPLAFLIGATPGICEELLFRGYVQSRLTTRLGGFGGILITSVFFAAFHMDLVHSTAVFALGVWLGWLCWQSGSIFPAMLAHFFNNAISVVAVSLGPEPGSKDVSVEAAAVMLGIFAVGTWSLLATLAFAWHYRQSPANAASAARS